MFSTLHFIWLAICAVVIVTSSLVTIKKRLSLQTGLTAMCVACVLSEVVKVFCVLISEERKNANGVFIKETDLPFHLCSLQIFFAFIARLTKKESLREFLLAFMIPTCALGGVAALFIPTISCSFGNPRTYQYFLYHAAIVWFAVFAVARGGVKLHFKAYLKMLATLLAIVFVTFYINGFFQNTNFLYLSEPPMDGLPILNMDHGWFIYFISYMAVALLLITLFFAPFWIYYKVKSKKDATEQA